VSGVFARIFVKFFQGLVLPLGAETAGCARSTGDVLVSTMGQAVASPQTSPLLTDVTIHVPKILAI
jgi:hypothetical protein